MASLRYCLKEWQNITIGDTGAKLNITAGKRE